VGRRERVGKEAFSFVWNSLKKAKERKNQMGPTLKTFPQQYGQKGWGNNNFCWKSPKCP